MTAFPAQRAPRRGLCTRPAAFCVLAGCCVGVPMVPGWEGNPISAIAAGRVSMVATFIGPVIAPG